MKYLILILAFIPFAAFSQSSSIAIKDGVSVSWINNSNLNVLVGSNVGFIYSAHFKKFQLSIEPSYHVKGFSDYVVFTDAMGNAVRSEKVSYKYSYIEIPVTIGFVPVNEKFIFGINVGLAPAFLINARAISPSYKYTFTNTENFNLDFIAGLKGGIRLSEKLFIALHLRYGTGLLDLGISSVKRTYGYISPFIEFGFKF